MPEKLEKLHLIICIGAALVVTVISIAKQVTLYRMSLWVSVTIVIFYMVGQLVRIFLTQWVFLPPAAPEDALSDPAAENDWDDAAEGDAEAMRGETEDTSLLTDAYDTDDK